MLRRATDELRRSQISCDLTLLINQRFMQTSQPKQYLASLKSTAFIPAYVLSPRSRGRRAGPVHPGFHPARWHHHPARCRRWRPFGRGPPVRRSAALADDQTLVHLNHFSHHHYFVVLADKPTAAQVAEQLRRAGNTIHAQLKAEKIAEVFIENHSAMPTCRPAAGRRPGPDRLPVRKLQN